MDSCVVERVDIVRPSILVRGLEAVVALLGRQGEPLPRLYPEELPERMQRDLGFLDGREPRYEDDRVR